MSGVNCAEQAGECRMRIPTLLASSTSRSWTIPGPRIFKETIKLSPYSDRIVITVPSCIINSALLRCVRGVTWSLVVVVLVGVSGPVDYAYMPLPKL